MPGALPLKALLWSIANSTDYYKLLAYIFTGDLLQIDSHHDLL